MFNAETLEWSPRDGVGLGVKLSVKCDTCGKTTRGYVKFRKCPCVYCLECVTITNRNRRRLVIECPKHPDQRSEGARRRHGTKSADSSPSAPVTLPSIGNLVNPVSAQSCAVCHTSKFGAWDSCAKHGPSGLLLCGHCSEKVREKPSPTNNARIYGWCVRRGQLRCPECNSDVPLSQ